ncbi:MAG: Flp family type IVb pilin [Erythrobacter sp.]|jgi:pilus assembly protein Flp/PilA|uniref:Flp family type IVb pilin n=1 Tax=Erythrobacter sp. TaxID=1042 RepID=UPI002B47C397|nr:Flp family type IVb pilin [Erythrobacter sp.]WRH70705.1 MAG: Flp family type IVb pilin [Erythrobacter sp.]
MLTNLLRTIKADTSGSSAVEYGLIVSLIIVAILVGMQEVATETIAMWRVVETSTLGAMGG